MEILVTGASGFLGQRLCKRLKDDLHNVFEVSSKDCDLTKEADVYAKLPVRKLDMIYHLAAWTRAGDFCLTHQGEQWIINQRINTNVLAWWKNCQPEAKMIAMGTSCSYDPALELKEENYLKGIPIDSLFSYAYTKRALYAGLLALNRQYGLKYMMFVPSTLYGASYYKDGRQMHFIFDLARKIVRGKKYGEKVVLWGSGEQKREIVHVNDAINAMITLSSHENDIINLGEGNEHTIKEFAQIICDHVGYDSSLIEYDTSRYVGAKSKVLNVDKMKCMLPNFKPTPIKEGIGEMVDWFMEQEVI
jgi:GDP-L-fucose synthase